MRLYLSTGGGKPDSPNSVTSAAQLGTDMYMYLAGNDSPCHAWAKQGTDRNNLKLRILLSYHYYKDTDLDALFAKYFSEPYPGVFADSGAFSAFTQGEPINWRDYAAWVKRWRHLFTVYANLDVIGDAEGTLTNQKRLEDAGLSPLPVFHTGEDWSYLEQYIKQYPYIALGGMVPYMRFPKKIMPWIIQCFKKAKGQSVFHGFGATSWKIIRDLPWYSVDSSSWGQGFRFGEVPLFDEKKGRFFKASLGDTKSCYKCGALFRRLGFDPEDFADRSRNDRAKICAVSALSYMLAEQWLRKRHGEIRIPRREDNLDGVQIHLVTARDNDTESDKLPGNMSIQSLSEGIKLHLATAASGATAEKGSNMSIQALSEGFSESGVNLYLADSTPPSRFDVGRVNQYMEQNDD